MIFWKTKSCVKNCHFIIDLFLYRKSGPFDLHHHNTLIFSPTSILKLFSFTALRITTNSKILTFTNGCSDNDHKSSNPRHSILPDSGPLGFDLTFAHGPTLHLPHYVGQLGSVPCPSTPTNAAACKNCNHSTKKSLFFSLESSLVYSLAVI